MVSRMELEIRRRKAEIRKQLKAASKHEDTRVQSEDQTDHNIDNQHEHKIKDEMDQTDHNIDNQHKHKIKDQIESLLMHSSNHSMSQVQHSYFPAFNVSQYPLESIDELLNYPTYSFTGPLAIYAAPQHCSYIDICHIRSLKRSLYQRKLLTLRSRYQTAWQRKRNLRAKAKKDEYHPMLFDLAEFLHGHPDLYSNFNYDYYYTGGNLCVLPVSGEVLHIDGDDLRNLNISYFSPESILSIETQRTLCSHTFDTDSEIFEVQPLRSNSDKLNELFAVRQRKAITLGALKNKNRIRPVAQLRSKQTPFISFAQSSCDENLLAVTMMNQHLRLYDLHKNKPILSKLYDELSDISWNTVQPWRERSFLYANQKRLCLMDLRSTPAEWLKSACGFRADEFGCELIASLATSGFSNLIYVATTHKLHCLDNRFMGKHFESDGAICRWTHQMEMPPLLMKTYRKDSNELIALASPVAGDLRICELTRTHQIQAHETDTKGIEVSKHIYKSYCLPYQPPTLQEVYDSTRLDGLCLQPTADLQQRIRRCHTGLSFCTTNPAADVMLLSSNSNGDVFVHSMQKRESQEHENRSTPQGKSSICKYASKISEQLPPVLNYTEIVDMKAMSKVFRCAALNPIKDEPNFNDSSEDEQNWTTTLPTNEIRESNIANKKPVVPRKRQFFGRWQKSLPKLYSYKDALVPDLLKVWDIHIKEEEKYSSICFNKNQQIKPDPDAKVQLWLTNSQPASEPIAQPMTAIPMANLNTSMQSVATVNASSMMQDPLFDNEIELSAGVPQSTQIFDDTVTAQVALVDTSAADMRLNSSTGAKQVTKKQVKKKTKYVKGF